MQPELVHSLLVFLSATLMFFALGLVCLFAWRHLERQHE